MFTNIASAQLCWQEDGTCAVHTQRLFEALFNDVTKDSILRKAILFLLTLACSKETLDIASWVIYRVIAVETDYRTCSLKSRGRYRQLSQTAVLCFYTKYRKCPALGTFGAPFRH